MLLLICSLALRKPLHNPPCCFCLLARGRRCLKGAWILNDYGAEHHSWAALCYDTGKEWAFKTWNLLGVVYYSSEPVLSHMYSLGWNVMWFSFRFLESSEGGIHGLKSGYMVYLGKWLHALCPGFSKGKDFAFGPVLGGIDGTYSPTLGGQQWALLNIGRLFF